MAIQRIQWTCPICNRRYAIPATAPTPSRCPQCRQEEEAAAASSAALAAAARDDDAGDDEQRDDFATLSALAAIQLEVAEEAARGPSIAAPVARHIEPSWKSLSTLSLVYMVLAGVAVFASFGGLLYGLRAAFIMPATSARATVIFEAVAAFAGGLIVALIFFTFRELIRLFLEVAENTRKP